MKAAQDALDLAVFKKIPTLTVDELKTIVVEDKWFGAIESGIIEEIERVTQHLANRVKTLEERYAETMPSLTKDLEKFTAKVEEHLKTMGLTW